jgi:uncharacterized protein YkwD
MMFVIAIFTLLGYTYGRTESFREIQIQKDKLTVAEETISLLEDRVQELSESTQASLLLPMPTPTPTPSPAPTLPPKQVESFSVDNDPWGVAKQIGEYTWTMKIQMDDRMATPQEVFEALNIYRQLHSKGTLTWDDRLGEYATSRAKHFTAIEQTDAHAGFMEYTKDIENVKKLGFASLGENSSFGFRMYGVHLIEWVYAGDEPHDKNQLNEKWTHVGVGVDGNQTDIIFGGNKID